MTGFQFRLAKILKLRVRREREAAREFARRQGLVEKCRRELDGTRQSRAELLQRRDSLQCGRVRPTALGENRYQIIVLERAETFCAQRLLQLERESESARRELIERSKERRLLEKLKERRRTEYEVEEARRERRELDARPLPRHGMAIAMRALNAGKR